MSVVANGSDRFGHGIARDKGVGIEWREGGYGRFRWRFIGISTACRARIVDRSPGRGPQKTLLRQGSPERNPSASMGDFQRFPVAEPPPFLHLKRFYLP
jgi:hypothetical protein